MRLPPPRSRWKASDHLKAIAAVTLLVFVGLTVKPSSRTQADSLDTPPTQAKKAQATTTARVLQRRKQERQIRADNYDLAKFPLNAQTEDHWRHLLWTTAVVEPREPFVAAALHQILSMTSQPGLSPAHGRIVDQALKVGTQLYLSDPDFYGAIGLRFVETVEQSPDPEWVAVALSGLVKGKLSVNELDRLSKIVLTRFPAATSNVYLQTTLQEIADTANPQALPPLKELLAWEIAPRQPHLYVLCRRDRRVLCQAVLKDRQGKFVQQGEGLWSVPLLLESIYGLGWNFTRGQTPQGIYRIEGVVPQPDDEYFRAYGQFPLVNLYVPFEPGAKQFLPQQPGAFTGSLADYTALLPASWRAYRPVQQSFWAGKVGRSLFRIHGSGEAVDFFRGKDKNVPASYNWNPTIGCLSARELYNEKGQLIHADMPKILQALKSVGGANFAGYLVVVEIPADEAVPVSLKTIEASIAATDRRVGRVSRKGPRSPVRKVAQRSSRSLLQQSLASSQQIRRQMASLSTRLDRLGQLESVPPRPATASDLKPLPIAY